MDYVMRERGPACRVARMSIVVALHAALAVGLVHGLKKAVIERPSEITVYPVNPDRPTPPTPVHRANEFPVSLPRIHVEAPTPPPVDIAPTITTAPPDTSVAPGMPTGPVEVAPVSPPAPADRLGAACPNSQAIRANIRYPVDARRDGITGDVVARFVVGASGGIRDVRIVHSTHRAFHGTVLNAVRQFNCVGVGQDVEVEVPFSFRLE